jgi:hypothetical protein
MSKLTIKSSLIAAVLVSYSSFTTGQHSQIDHEKLVDDFYTPYPFTLAKQQKFTGTIGELKPQPGGDLWDYFVFQSPGYGKVDIVLDDFSRPVTISLEQHSPSGHRSREMVAESVNRFADSHEISARVSPLKTYYIAVGSGLLDNGLTPYALTVKFRGAEAEPASPASTGEYALALSGRPCSVPGSGFSDLELPVYVVSEHGTKLSTQNESDLNVDKRIHEMFRFDATYGMLVHEFSHVLVDQESAMSLQRDVVVVGNFEGGEFRGEVSEHDILRDFSGNVVEEGKDCSRQVTAVGQ